MSKSKRTVTFTIEEDQQTWLEAMASAHNLPDASKALRVLLDYAQADGDEAEIFGKIRCKHCG
jgi:hypothetical protein